MWELSTFALLAAWMLVAVLLGLLIWMRRRAGVVEAYPYARRQRLLSPAGRHFLGVLEAVTAGEYRIFVKVRVTDVVRITHRPGSTRFRRARRRVAGYRFDFVLCDADTLDILCAVNLDERSRHQSQVEDVDGFPEALCRNSGLPWLRVIARRDYDLADVRRRLREAIAAGEARRPVADTEVTMVADEDALAPPMPGLDAWPDPGTGADRAEASEDRDTAMSDDAARADPEAPACPRCAGAMMRRHIHIGRHPGGEFWSCMRFPECRGIVPVLRDARHRDAV